MLDVVHGLGFEGVELAQSPGRLYDGNYSRLTEELAKRELKLLGLARGSLDARMRFLGNDRRPYLYCEKCEEEELEALARGYRLALHAHAYKKVHRFEDATEILGRRKDSNLLWLPDTAHLTIVGNDPINSIREFKQRLAGVHLKDWTPIYGRLSHRYAKGFVELGTGEVRIKDTLDYLKSDSSLESLWLIYEQDHTPRTPEESLRDAAAWFENNGVPMRWPGYTRLSAGRSPKPWPPSLERSKSLESETKLLREISDAAVGDYYAFYDRSVRLLKELFDAKLVAISALGEAYDSVSHLAVWPLKTKLPLLEPRDPLLSRAIESPEIIQLDHAFASPLAQSAHDRGASKALLVPITNSYNPNHCRLMISVFTSAQDNWRLEQVNARLLARHFGRAADVNLDDFCTVAASEVALAATKERDLKGFTKRVHELILRLVQAEGCSIFLASADNSRLEPAYAPKLRWFPPYDAPGRQYYERGIPNLVTQAWERREPRVIPDISGMTDRKVAKRSEEMVEGPLSSMFVPIVDPGGDCLGVVRCANKRSGQPFSDDDIAIVDTMLQAAVPHLRLLREADARERAYAKLRHELKNPIVAILNNIENLEYEINKWQLSADLPPMRFDYLGDVKSWAELMEELTGHLRYLSRDPAALKPRAQRIGLIEIVAPVVRQLRSEFRENGLSERAVEYDSLRSLPALFLDRFMFQAVFFNLVDNAIKYNDRAHKRFVLRLSVDQSANEFVVKICDNGRGIEDGLEEAVFEEGFRGPAARALDVEGNGLGLWIVKRLVEAHGGSISLTHNHEPTEFTIRLPKRLSSRSPEVTE
jgi:signal transduction histidine kinase/sugar phosphate isomerase/epimerase